MHVKLLLFANTTTGKIIMDVPKVTTAPIQIKTVSTSRSPTTMTTVSPLHGGSFHDHYRRDSVSKSNTIRQPKVLHPVDRIELSLLLLENISQDAVRAFKEQGFQVHHQTKAWTEDELVEKIGAYHAIGIRSKTKITKRVLRAASKVCSIFNLPYSINSALINVIAFGNWMFLHRDKSGRPSQRC